MNEQEKKELLKMTRHILGSKTKSAEDLKRLVVFYHENLDTAPPFPEEKPKVDDLLATVKEFRFQQKEACKEMRADLQDIGNLIRQLYEDRTGRKWRPSLRVIQGGGNITPIPCIVTRHKEPVYRPGH